MACKLERPTPETLFNRIRDMFSVTVLGGAPVIPESNEWYVVANDYAMAETFHAYADQLLQDLDPATACCESLITLASRNGVYPRPATFAEGYAKLTGIPDAPLPSRIEIITNLGSYVSIGTVPSAIGTRGSAVFRVQALVPGPGQSGVVTSAGLTAAIPNVDNTVVICGGIMCGGQEAETCEQFRSRYLDRIAYHPRMTMEWIKAKLLEWPCATRVCQRSGSCCTCGECGDQDPCGCKDCGGRLDFYVMFDDVFECGIAPANVINDIRNWMFGENQGFGEGQVEVGVCGNIYNATAIKVNVTIDIVACPTADQLDKIHDTVVDYFKTICPSQTLYAMAIKVLVANELGADVNTDVNFSLVNDSDKEFVAILPCGDLEPDCDYVFCVNEVNFTYPPLTTSGCS